MELKKSTDFTCSVCCQSVCAPGCAGLAIKDAALPDAHAELRRLAEAATPGPWGVDSIKSEGEYGDDDNGGFGFTTYAVTDDKGQCIVDCLNNDNGIVQVDGDDEGCFTWDVVAERDAKFIAAANPARILALLDEVAGLRAALAQAAPASPASAPVAQQAAVPVDRAFEDTLLSLVSEWWSVKSGKPARAVWTKVMAHVRSAAAPLPPVVARKDGAV